MKVRTATKDDFRPFSSEYYRYAWSRPVGRVHLVTGAIAIALVVWMVTHPTNLVVIGASFLWTAVAVVVAAKFMQDREPAPTQQESS